MSETKDDGGSAFPTLETEQYHPQFGMSLRDYFAAAALQGIVANDPVVSADLLKMFGGPERSRGDVAATAAYVFADAMIKARKS
jgi:hypothetical protein